MTQIQFCARDSCHRPAVGISAWAHNSTGAPQQNLCRPHRLETIQAVRCEVVGDLAITDVRTQQGVTQGNVVELDPVETNIASLVYAGHVKVVEDAKPAAAGSKKASAGD